MSGWTSNRCITSVHTMKTGSGIQIRKTSSLHRSKFGLMEMSAPASMILLWLVTSARRCPRRYSSLVKLGRACRFSLKNLFCRGCTTALLTRSRSRKNTKALSTGKSDPDKQKNGLFFGGRFLLKTRQKDFRTKNKKCPL